MVNLKISPKAQKDMLEIKEYIFEELGNPTAATNVLAKITKRFRDLMEFPLIGAPLSSVIKIETSYRYLTCGQYTAFYRYENDTVYVDRVLYGRRDFMRILFGDVAKEEDN
ncbi:type II toxin-antitoxin system RelE/ParE family toxin [Thermoanaerobacterium sp. CMT5567-10]|uniref:type II toxin-antitoxin system RelE/ParE family toxin n=1 Tax=Thermoanaerobacterium sp. CMT5567-10 TaxID=3061989 RepID=UPI0026E072DE|nr:type II toxin-antitoxin system RelE/ParE family toxin [Thermoanaerobacterium sp. CMT5567-10]WKV08438.1 type II toxin-antitoxin system RelE/ParE family toxin [Thermoanaerobacterium sp. CMT5567-10]